MIGRILKSGSFASKVDYVTRVNHDHRIFTPDTWKILASDGLMGEKRNQILASFEAQAMENPRIGNPAGHITLSFSADDKRKLTDEKMLQIAKDYIKKMGLDRTQWLIVRHYETDKPHCHIVFNMVGNDGKRMESGRNRYRNKRVCEALDRKYRLAKPKRQAPDLEKLHGVEKAKAEIRIAATEALAKSKDWYTFALELSKKGVTIIPKYRLNTTEMQGVSFQLGDYKVKGSDVCEQFKFSNLERYFSSFTRQNAPEKATVRQSRQPQDATHSFVDDALKAAKATAELAKDVAADVGMGLTSAVGGLFQPGNGNLDENERAMAWRLAHPKKKRKGRSI